MSEPGKPLYRVPSMAEIAAIEPTGLTVASLFAGCGGSCLGYRMAGYRVAWANEFIPAARESYRANYPETPIDPRDIRQIDPGEILAAIGMRSGELDLLDGSPPCAAFSTSGKREAGWGKVRKYSDTVQRTDDLFAEYARILRGLMPRVFVAENVSGLVKGTAKGHFLAILADLKAAGYRVAARLLDAQWLGVPQARQRIFFVGVREDLHREPAFPKPLPYRYSVREALPWIRHVSGRTKPQFHRGESPVDRPMNSILVQDPDQTRYEIEADADMSRYAVEQGSNEGFGSDSFRPIDRHPSPTIGAGPQAGNGRCPPSQLRFTDPASGKVECRKFSIAELRRICGFPDDFALTGSYAQQWERLGRAVPPVMMAHLAAAIRDRILLPARREAAR